MTEIVCNICGETRFGPGFNGRMAPGNLPPACMTCGSAERHRAMRAVFERLASILSNWRGLHFAPDPSVDQRWFRSYTTSVYGQGKYYDMQATGLPPDSFDLILASHVLEHVADDAVAVGECLRILSPNGILALCVPIPMYRWDTDDWGFADPARNDHRRNYGSDFWLRLSGAVPDMKGLFVAMRDPVTGVTDHLYLLSRGEEGLEQVGQLLIGANTPFLRLSSAPVPSIQPTPVQPASAQPTFNQPALEPLTLNRATDIEKRRHIKNAYPKYTLADTHMAHCRVVPTRERMVELLPPGGVVAEVGATFGDFTQEILRRNHPHRLHLLDPWSGEQHDRALTRLRSTLAPRIEDGTVEINQGLPLDMLQRFPDVSFDWLYISGDHSYSTTAAVLEISRAKVKPDGLIAGHGFCSGNELTLSPYGVIEAVHEFCVKQDWEYLYLTLEQHGHFSFCLRKRQG